MMIQFHKQDTVNINGIDIYYETFGDPNNPAVLLIMGLGSQCVHWFPYFYEPIVQKGYYVIRFDNRDLGRSSRVSTSYNLEDMANDTISLLDKISIKQAHIIGISMGGMIAQRLAISHQSYVKTLTSIASSGFFDDPDPALKPTPKTALAEKILLLTQKFQKDSEEYNLGLWEALSGSAYPFDQALHRQLYQESFVIQKGYNAQASQNQTQAMLKSGSRLSELGQIKAATLIIHGTDDPMIPESHGLKYHPLILKAKYLKMPGVGHEIPKGICSTLHPEIFELLK
jgi:pimeloyl-ACP methyl ester carboxylesterase